MRNGLVDYSRLIAALGIVWFHTEAPGFHAAYAAVPFFLVLLSLPSSSSFSDRARRLLVPFVVWSAIYAALRVSSAYHADTGLFEWWRPWMVLIGTSIHLWFLPFAFLVAVAARFLKAKWLVLALPVLAAIGLAFLPGTLGYPWYQWSFGLVPALVGFSFAQSGMLALAPLAAAYAVLTVLRPAPDNVIILAGSALAILALSMRLPQTRASDWCARVSMWVYLGHVLVINRGETIGLQGFPLLTFSVAGSILLAVGIDVVGRRLGWRVGQRA